ncbi:MAG: 4-hydroxy-tetrahydrodipicolinate synthase [Methanomassiliicoccales archaeon]|nr:MAG: 4-hydroxy-tetrahydrodipicolinate synthase [Methanomassiliicoccales archaeon]
MPKTKWFKGVFPALVTPYTEDEKIDDDAFRKLMEFLLPNVNGIVPCGTTGEFMYLTENEKRHVIDLAVDEVKGKVPVIAGTGCPSTKHTVELTQYAKDAGAKAALVVSPFYLKPSYKELYEHYDALNNLDFPIILYNIPQCTGVHKKWWTTEGLAQLENVIGIKDSSGDMGFMMALFEKIKGKISIFCGNDEIGMPALATGADGLILASANLIPDVWQEIYMAVKNGEIEKAQDLQASIQKLARIIVRNGANQAVKEGLHMIGMDMGNSRRPVMPGGPFKREDREELRIQLENLGKIPKRKIEFEVRDNEIIESEYPAVPYTPPRISDFTMKVGEGFAGPPIFELAHIDLLIGVKDGPVGAAINEALEKQESEGNDRLRIISEKPKTLLVPTVTVRTKRQAENIYSHAAKGVNLAVEKSINDGVLPPAILDDICMIANVFVHPAAANRHRIMFNNYKAMLHATRKAIEERPSIKELLLEKECARHPFKYTP